MGLLGRFTGGGDDDPSGDGPDSYRISHMTDKGGWEPVDGYDDMAEPIDKQTFEYNAAPLEPGEYRLFAVKSGMNRQPPEGVGWTLSVEGDDRGPDQAADDELRRELQALRAEMQENSGSTAEDIQEMLEKQKAAVGMQMLQNEEFVRRYGDKLALSLLDVDDGSGGSGVEMEDFETFKDNPISATAYQLASTAAEDPEAVEQLSQSVGNSLGSFLGGAAGGMAGQQHPHQQSTPPDHLAGDTTDDEPDTGRDVSAGPSDPSELGVDPTEAVETDTDELAEIVAEGQQARKQAEADDAGGGEVVRREGPGTTTTDDSDPMTAGPTVDADGDPAASDPDGAGDGIDTVDDAAEQLQSDTETTETTEMNTTENGHDDDADVQPADEPQTAADVAEGL